MKQVPTRFTSIDGLRAIAAFGIALMHVQANVSVTPGGNFLYDTIIPSFTDFVYMFFMISAFALCCGYYDKFKEGKIRPNDFYKKRYSRVLPFFVILIIINDLIPHAPNKFASANALVNESGLPALVETLFESFADITLGFALLPNPHISVIGVGWFLGVIFLFYMLFPFFVFMIDNKKRAWISLGISYAFTFIAIAYFFGPKFIDFDISRHSIIYDLSFFVLGGIIYLYKDEIYNALSDHKIMLLMLCVIITITYWLWECNPYCFVVKVGILSAVWLIYAICTNTRLLNNRVMSYLGGISMEIYLSHMMCFRGVSLLKLDRYIADPHMYFWIVSGGTLTCAVIFSHIIKYRVLPILEKKLHKS